MVYIFCCIVAIGNAEAIVKLLMVNRTRAHLMVEVALTQPFFTMAETLKGEAET